MKDGPFEGREDPELHSDDDETIITQNPISEDECAQIGGA